MTSVSATANDTAPNNNPGLVVAICHVDFDIVEGQKVDHCYPPKQLTPCELNQVAFHSFGDSLSYELHATTSLRDTSFTFTIQRDSKEGTQGDDSAGKVQELYGAVVCRTKTAAHLPRGGEQRSVVVVSLYPVTSLLAPLCRFAAPLVFSYGAQALKQVYDMVQDWPSLTGLWGTTFSLPLGHAAIECDLPDLSSLPISIQQEETTQYMTIVDAHVEELDDSTGLPLCLLPQAYGQQELVRGMYGEVDVFTPLQAALPQLWTLWELAMTAQPILVLSPTPAACSATVMAIVSLMAPFPGGKGVRPYFSLHDPGFAKFAEGLLPDGENNLPWLLGGTNPYFLKALKHWPNILSSGYTSLTQTSAFADDASSAASPRSFRDNNTPFSPKSNGGSIHRSISSSAQLGNRPASAGTSRLAGTLNRILRRPQGPQYLLSQPVDGVWLSLTQPQPLPSVKPSRAVLDSLIQVRAEDSMSKRHRVGHLNSTILRRHFEELTRAVLFPLLQFITPLQAPSGDVGRLQRPSMAKIPQFDAEAVVSSIEDGTGVVPDILMHHFDGHKGLAQFYRRFLANPAVVEWIEERRCIAEEWQRRVWRAAYHAAGGGVNLPGVLHTDEVAAVEAYIKLEMQVLHSNDDDEKEIAAAKAKLKSAFQGLPEDLKRNLLLNENRAMLLGLI